MKKHSKSKRKNQAVRQYFIPMTKNQLQRKVFEQSVHQWVNKKFQFVKLFIEAQTTNEKDSDVIFKKKSKQLQNEFLLKHKIEGLISFLPLDYYETLIKYVMQKKLYWTFKVEDSPELNSQTQHKTMEVQLALALKKYYKSYEYNQGNLHNSLPQKSQDSSRQAESFNPNRTSVRSSFKKSNPDFLYELLMMFSVSVVAVFFQHFFPQLQIDKIFRSEIYIIINHSFLDMEVSPSVYDIMQKKHCTNKNERNFKSLNASYIHEFSTSFHKNSDKNPNNPDSKRTIGDEKIKSTAMIGNQTLNKFILSQSKQNDANNSNSNDFNSIDSNGLSTLIGLENKPMKKPAIKKEFFIKPTTSIGNCLPSDRPKNGNTKNFKSHPNMQPSRFNSFLKDAKQIVMPSMLEEALDNGYLPTNQEVDFYSTIKNCLYIDALPPIKKKKMNIYQYQKLNEVDKLKEIKKQIRTIDQQSKKHYIMSNDISLAMNTFISTSFDFPKKNKVQRDTPIVTEYMKKHNNFEKLERKTANKSFIASQDKENYQLKKLPLKASNLKFQLTKSCNFYKFDDKVLQIGQIPQKQNQHIKTGTTIPFPSARKLNELQKSLTNDKFIQRNKKSSTQVVEINQLLKSTQLKNETMILRESDKRAGDKKRQIEKRKNSRQRISELQSNGSNIDLRSISSFKHIESRNNIQSFLKRVQKNEIQDQKAAQQRESIMNTFQLSQKMQRYELGTKQVTQIELINQKTNRTNSTARYGGLEGQVNVQRDVLTNYKSMYKSFELKKKLKDFQATCKRREDISNYSVFYLHTGKDPMVYAGAKSVKEEDDEESKGRPSECTAS